MSNANDFEIPAFLRRTPAPTGETPMTPASQTPAPAKAPKLKRRDAYVARLTISIPLDMTNADSLASAIKAVGAIKALLPADAAFKSEGSLGKI